VLLKTTVLYLRIVCSLLNIIQTRFSLIKSRKMFEKVGEFVGSQHQIVEIRDTPATILRFDAIHVSSERYPSERLMNLWISIV
jgi:hypothetical protein